MNTLEDGSLASGPFTMVEGDMFEIRGADNWKYPAEPYVISAAEAGFKQIVFNPTTLEITIRDFESSK